jgi:hypothetical protein
MIQPASAARAITAMPTPRARSRIEPSTLFVLSRLRAIWIAPPPGTDTTTSR